MAMDSGERVLEQLERKDQLLCRKHEIHNQLAGNPREPFFSALKKELQRIEEDVKRADERFLHLYSMYRMGLSLRENGEIDVSKLSGEQKVILRKMRVLVKRISAIGTDSEGGEF